MTTHARVLRAVGAIAIVTLAAPVIADQTFRPDAGGFLQVSPDDVHFTDNQAMQAIVILGDPTKPGLYILRNRFPPGVMSRPHFHNQDRYVTVIKGTWWTASGPSADVFDPAKTTPLKTGSFMFHPAGGHHYDGAKDEEVIVQIMGMGPVTTTNLPGGGG